MPDPHYKSLLPHFGFLAFAVIAGGAGAQGLPTPAQIFAPPMTASPFAIEAAVADATAADTASALAQARSARAAARVRGSKTDGNSTVPMTNGIGSVEIGAFATVLGPIVIELRIDTNLNAQPTR